MRLLAWTLLLFSCLLLTSGREPTQRVIHVSTVEELQAVFSEPLENVTVRLAPGTYSLQAQSAEISVGSMATRPITVGLRIAGRNLRVTGPDEGSAELVSTALFRLYFDGCEQCALEHVTVITESPNPPDSTVGAAVLATNSVLRITNCVINDRAIPLSADGIVGGAGSSLEILYSEITGNGTGATFFDDAYALLRNNLIEGISPARFALAVGGESRVVAERNHLRNLNDGVRLGGRSSIELRANIIEDVEGSGIQSRHPELGRVRIEKNVIYRCGMWGIVLRAEGDQRATGNFVVETSALKGGSAPIAVHGARSDAAVRKNTLYANNSAEDVPREIFRREQLRWNRTYRNTPVGVDGRHKFYESEYLQRYGRWLH